jgi:hypothetical protein
LVRAASGEFGEGRSPAKNRAVSSAVAASAQLARAAPNTTVKVIRMVAIIRVAATDTVCSASAYPPRQLLTARLGRIVKVYVPGWLGIPVMPSPREHESLGM